MSSHSHETKKDKAMFYIACIVFAIVAVLIISFIVNTTFSILSSLLGTTLAVIAVFAGGFWAAKKYR